MTNYMLNGKICVIFNSQYFPEPKSFWEKVKVVLDLSNYATKADLKNATGAHTSKFAKEVDLMQA